MSDPIDRLPEPADDPTDDSADDPFSRIDGDIVNGTFATCAAKVDASAWRLMRYEPNQRLLFNLAAWAGAVAVVFVAAGVTCLVATSGFWWTAAGVLSLGVALAAGALAAFGVYALLRTVPMMRTIYGNALLTPGVVVSADPLEFVSMANMRTGLGDDRYAVKRVAAGRLPGLPAVVGTRVTCVSGFQDGPTEEAWGGFDPRPLVWGTRDADVLAARARKLGDEAFAELEAVVRAGRIPAKADELLWLDGDDAGRPDVAAGPKPPPLPVRPPPLPTRQP